MNFSLYSEPVWALFHDFQHLGCLDDYTVSARADVEGKHMVFYAKHDSDCIILARAEVLGSPVLMALAEFTCRELEGLALDDVSSFLKNFPSIASDTLLLSPNEAHLIHWVNSILHSLLGINGGSSDDSSLT